jgi:hypothetical protein
MDKMRLPVAVGIGLKGEEVNKMKNGVYLATTRGFDRVDFPAGGFMFLRNGELLGGGRFMYYIGSYSAKDGIFKGECVVNPHTPPPPDHLFYNARDFGAGLSAPMRVITPS